MVRTVEKEKKTVSGKLNEKRPTFSRNSLDVSFSSSSPTFSTINNIGLGYLYIFKSRTELVSFLADIKGQ